MSRGAVVIVFCMVLACTANKENDVGKDIQKNSKTTLALFTLMNPLKTGVNFVNALTETPDMNGFFYEYYYNGAGVSLADINNDGLQDILFISSLRQNALYLNRGGLKFKNITKESGLIQSVGFRTGVTNVDINGDGWMDFYISKSGKYDDPAKRKNELWVNKGVDEHGIPAFVEQAADYNLDIEMCSTQAAFFDYDLDGDLDMFLINHYTEPFDYRELENLSKKKGVLTGDRLYQNRQGKFVDVTHKAGITNTSRLSYGLGISVGDLDNDGWPDVYVSNDYEGKDYLYMNGGDGTFKEVSNEALGHASFYSMGTDIGDVNNDGWLDFMSLDMMAEDNYTMKTSMSGMNPEKFEKVVNQGLHYQYMYNALQLNNGIAPDKNIPVFSDVAQQAGVASTDWSWGPLFFDMDNDGLKDIFVSNGIKKDFRNNDFVIKQKTRKDKIRTEDRDAFIMGVLNEMPERKKLNYFFKNKNGLSFENKSTQWVADIPSSSNGAAYGDLDNDGDLDMVVNNTDDVSLIYKNETMEQGLGNYLKLRFEGPPENTVGIGARVTLYSGGQVQLQEQYLTRGFQSAIAPGIHFGVGKIQSIDRIVVTWPDGKKQEWREVEVNQEIVVKYKDSIEKPFEEGKVQRPIFSTIEPGKVGLNWIHSENKFDDFKRESLLPHKMSTLGPAMAVGDYDEDGLQDIFLGGAKNQESVLFKQNPNGSFQQIQQTSIQKDKHHEDVDASFFDADGDGDLDLYVVSGGNEEPVHALYYQDRFYENRQGEFILQGGAIPSLLVSGSCVKTIDYDADGDLDLFVGGRQFPGRYPSPVSSYLLRNDSRNQKIKFTDVSQEVFPALAGIGMVSDAVVADIDNDGTQDLIMVGEWMPVRLFYNNGGKFEEEKTEELSHTAGWWNTIKAADFDNDGDLDLIAGNLGLNYKYKASTEKPFRVFANDFDSNGTFDIVLGYYDGDDLYPLRGRQCSSNQMPFIKKKFTTYDAFGKATLEEVYGKNHLDQSVNYKAETFATTYFENLGEGIFKPRPLEPAAQTTTVNDLLIEDFNADGKLDILLAGNLYGSEVETPRNDAGLGLFMEGDGKGNFSAVPMHQSGLMVVGEVKKMHGISWADKKIIVVARNNDQPCVIGIRDKK
ncbi:MAG: VCBS repeat-containing protein [Cyclobacteriaceae bacterium]